MSTVTRWLASSGPGGDACEFQPLHAPVRHELLEFVGLSLKRFEGFFAKFFGADYRFTE